MGLFKWYKLQTYDRWAQIVFWSNSTILQKAMDVSYDLISSMTTGRQRYYCDLTEFVCTSCPNTSVLSYTNCKRFCILFFFQCKTYHIPRTLWTHVCWSKTWHFFCYFRIQAVRHTSSVFLYRWWLSRDYIRFRFCNMAGTINFGWHCEISTRRHVQSVYGLNSSLTQLACELHRCKALQKKWRTKQGPPFQIDTLWRTQFWLKISKIIELFSWLYFYYNHCFLIIIKCSLVCYIRLWLEFFWENCIFNLKIRSYTSGESRIIFLPERSSICLYPCKKSAINVKKQSRARLLLTHPALYILKIQKTYGAFWKPPFENQPKSARP